MVQHLPGETFDGLARAYTMSFSICYMVAPFLGLHISLIGFVPSALFLVGIGCALAYAVYSGNRSIMLFLAVGEAIACVGHFLGVVPWVPVFSENSYIVMALMDLVQSLCLFKLLDL